MRNDANFHFVGHSNKQKSIIRPLWSRLLPKTCPSYWTRGGYPNARLGSRKGFSNIAKAQCHSVATAVMNAADTSVHENVFGFDGSQLEENCTHDIDMAQQLFCAETRIIF